jgi:hypothetical protein
MNRAAVCIDTFGALDQHGLITPSRRTPWESDQSGPGDVRRAQVYPKLLPSFGKLTLPDRLAFSAAALMLTDYDEPPGESTAVCLAIPSGSLSTDLRYCESVLSGAPSPAWFSATLPSSSVSEIAIQYKCKGPNRVFAAGDGLDWVWALDAGYRLVAQGQADKAIVVVVDALEASDRDSPAVPACAREQTNRALALLLRRMPGRGMSAQLRYDMRAGSEHGSVCGGAEYFGTLLSALTAETSAVVHIPYALDKGTIALCRGEAWSS